MSHSFTSIRLAYHDFREEFASRPVFTRQNSVSKLRTSTPISLSPDNSSNQDHQHTDTRLGRFVADFHNVTRRFRRIHVYRGRGSESTTRPITAVPYYETAVPVLSSSSASHLQQLTTRFLTNWNPVRIRRDSLHERDRIFRRLNFRSQRAQNLRRNRFRRDEVWSSSSESIDSLPNPGWPSSFIDASSPDSNFFSDQEDIRRDSFSVDSALSDNASVEDFNNSVRDAGPTAESEPIADGAVTRRSTFSRIVTFSFHRTRAWVELEPFVHATPASGSSEEVQADDNEDLSFAATTSTGSTSNDPVKLRRRTFRHSVGRNRELYEMLGSFEDFHLDPL